MSFQHIVTVSAVCLTLAFTGWEYIPDETFDAVPTGRKTEKFPWFSFAYDLPENGVLGCCVEETDCVWTIFRFPPCEKETSDCWPLRNILMIVSLIVHVSFFIVDVLRQNGLNGTEKRTPEFMNGKTYCQPFGSLLDLESIKKDHQMRLEEMAKTVEFINRQHRSLEIEKEQLVLHMTYPSLMSVDGLLTRSPQMDNIINKTYVNSSSEESVSGEPNITEHERMKAEFDDPDYEWDIEYGIG